MHESRKEQKLTRAFKPLNAAFLVFCLFMTIIYGQEIYQTKLEGDFAFSNTLFFVTGILGLTSLGCKPHFAKLSIIVSAALCFLMFVYAFIVTVASIGPIEGSGAVISPSIEELLLPLAIGALSGLTFLTNFAREVDQDGDTRARGK